MKKTISTAALLQAVVNDADGHPARSAWGRGVQSYAVEIAETIAQAADEVEPLRAALEPIALDGATGWEMYSYGGCSLVYDADIARALCTPSELKRKRGGELQPSRCETWLDVQARALRHAMTHVCVIAKRMG